MKLTPPQFPPSPDAAGTSSSLLRSGLADPLLLKTKDASVDVICHFLGPSRIDDKAHVIDSDGGLGNVGGENKLGCAYGGPKTTKAPTPLSYVL